jgi:hypothetical protein
MDVTNISEYYIDENINNTQFKLWRISWRDEW